MAPCDGETHHALPRSGRGSLMRVQQDRADITRKIHALPQKEFSAGSDSAMGGVQEVASAALAIL